MGSMIITPTRKLSGTIEVPGDKSISHRAVMLGAIAKGETPVTNLLACDDCDRTIDAFRAMGITIRKKGGSTVIRGRGLRGLTKPHGSLAMGESGTSMRLLAGILAAQRFETVLDADASLAARPMQRIIEPLAAMGARIDAAAGGHPPLVIHPGALAPINYTLPVPSAQVKSAVLLAGLYASGTTIVTERYRSRDHTERMLKVFGASITTKGLRVAVKGGKELTGRPVAIPGDISSASFFIAAAILLEGSRVVIRNAGINPTRAGILTVLKRMGAKVALTNRRGCGEPVADIVASAGAIRGVTITEREMPAVIDELPVIFVLAALAKGRTVIRGAGELKVKETDRIRSMSENLRRMGAAITTDAAAITIDGVRRLGGAALKSYGDHRTCMAMAVAALTANGESSIDDTACVAKSFPGFFETLRRLDRANYLL